MNYRKIFLAFGLIIFTDANGQSGPTQDQVEHAQNRGEWELNWLAELNSTDEPWMWPLSLYHLDSIFMDREFIRSATETTIDKLLTHPSPGAEALYWAAARCTDIPMLEDVCRVPELLKRLMEVDGDNLFSFALHFEIELADRTGIGRTDSESWDWSYFDSWLEHAVTLENTDNYDFLHASAMFEKLLEYAKTEGIYSNLKSAPGEWRVAYYVVHEIYPWHGSMRAAISHCRSSQYQGRKSATQTCRKIANRLLENSKSFGSRSEALALLAETYSRSDPEFIRLLRESEAWRGPVVGCLNNFHQYANREWTINYDAGLFIQEYESLGEIAALQNLADSAGWNYKDDASNEYKCTEIPAMPDKELSKILGKQDPAWTWCEDGEFCDPPLPPDL